MDRSGELRLADVSEDELLTRMLPLLTAGATALLGPGDDAAVLATSGAVVATTDTMVRDRDWRDDWSCAQDVGRKVVAQNVADIAAMGALPTGLLVALAADPQTPVAWVLDLARGIAAGAQAAGCGVIGGDLSSAPEGVVMVAVTALGDLDGRAPVLRSGAQVGDVVAVRGTLGRSGGGWQLYAADAHRSVPADAAMAEAVEVLLEAHRTAGAVPWQAGAQAADAGAHALIDVSDGLVRDLGRVARASKVAIDLSAELMAPFVAGPLTVALGPADALRQVLSGGEEHSLLGCFAAGAIPAGWEPIGTVTHPDQTGAVTLDGAVPEVLGWDHFAG